ncbi:FAD-dependent oxidoreductase [Mycobacterium sp. NPDC006124]|uniref:FAD-dependent oxidoreductase n=1 Tax=Mycobacterium sp. NPDC006124 TaxID=3156729 RepID=UPI0033B7DD82
MKCIVVGAGAWGLPAAAELARRGHDVCLVDRHGPFNALSSSVGPTRLWRLADPNPARVRLARRGLEAMRRLAERANTEVFLTRGLLWRDDVSLTALLRTLAGQDVEHTEVSASDVGRFFPGLRPDGRDAVWQPVAGVVLAETSLRAQLESYCGTTLFGYDVVDLEMRPSGVRVSFAGGQFVDADVAVLAAGPGAAGLLGNVGVRVDLHPYLEQVVHFGDAAHPHSSDALPGLFDGPTASRPGVYGMPTPGRGYKIGLDTPLRDYRRSDENRTPDPGRTNAIRDYVRDGLSSVPTVVLDEQVCVWTDSPDGSFVVDRLPGGVVFACGDSGEGFKYSALMGEILADLAEGRTPDDDVAALSMARFADGTPQRSGPHVLGRH